jgi:hypothetical protein
MSTMLEHALYSPDIVRYNIKIFRHLKKTLKWCWFQSDTEVRQPVHDWFLSAVYEILWDRHPFLGDPTCLNTCGNCMTRQYRSSVISFCRFCWISLVITKFNKLSYRLARLSFFQVMFPGMLTEFSWHLPSYRF